MYVTSNSKRVLVQMTTPSVARVIPEVTLEAMRRVAMTLQVRMAADVEKVRVESDDHRAGFYNFYIFPKPGRQFSDAEVSLIGDRTKQVWEAAGLPTA